MAVSSRAAGESVARFEREVCVPIHLLPRKHTFRGERRRHPRHDLACTCWVEAPGLTLFGPIHDIGAGGLFVRTAARIEPGTRVELSLHLSGETETLLARAVVARSEPRAAGLPSRGLGLEFIAIERGSALLRSLLERSVPPIG